MPFNLPKYAKTENGIIVFSNCINHADAVMHIFGEVDMLSFGFIKCSTKDDELVFDLFHKLEKKSLEDPTILESIENEYFCPNKKLKYILTSSRFIIFSEDLTHKYIANNLFTGFVIQGAGEVSFQIQNGKPKIVCSGECKELGVFSRDFDSQILEDAFEIWGSDNKY